MKEMVKGNEGITVPLPPRKRAVRLQTARDARRFLSKIINGVFRDELDAQKAARIGYLLGIYLRSLEVDELAQRLDAIEKRIEGRG
jgi:hypothetical protein